VRFCERSTAPSSLPAQERLLVVLFNLMDALLATSPPDPTSSERP
jgi:hypothetical protein